MEFDECRHRRLGHLVKARLEQASQHGNFPRLEVQHLAAFQQIFDAAAREVEMDALSQKIKAGRSKGPPRKRPRTSPPSELEHPSPNHNFLSPNPPPRISITRDGFEQDLLAIGTLTQPSPPMAMGPPLPTPSYGDGVTPGRADGALTGDIRWDPVPENIYHLPGDNGLPAISDIDFDMPGFPP